MSSIRNILTALILCISITAYAEWDKNTRKEFANATDYSLKFDWSQTNYNGMDSVDFVQYYAAKFNMDPKNLAIVLDYIPQRLTSAIGKKFGKKASITFNGNSRYCILIELTEITEKAGLKAKVTRYVDSPSNGEVFYVKVSDGRWNSFDELLEENIEELAKKIAKQSSKAGKESPFKPSNSFDPLYD